jgi:hypothetical protein
MVMIKSATRIFALAGATFATACAQTPPGPLAAARATGGQCFLARQVTGFSSATMEAVNVEVGVGRYYRLDLTGTCANIDWSTGLVLRTLGGGSWICNAADAEIVVPGQPGGRCLVTGVHPITKAQYLARPR